MKKLSRREFLGKSALGIGAAVMASQLPLDLQAGTIPEKYKLPLGFQTWTIRSMLAKDFPGTLKTMADMGYKSLEMCSPAGYATSGFGPLTKYSAKEMKQIINDAGLICESSHYVMDELRNHLDERIEFALASGQKQMILSMFGLPPKPTLSDWLKAADELNGIGSKVKAAGLQMGYHNHDMEFGELEGKLIYDELMKQFDPDVIKMQFQVAVIRLGYKASTYFAKYPGRFISAHFADWSPEKKSEVPIGQGIVDWDDLFKNIEKGGVKNIFVEMGMNTFKESAEYLKKYLA
jgi:sugar phosphate isomerase/epimerase